MGKQYYAVRKGRNPGIYRNWDDAKEQIRGFSGAIFKGFATEAEAKQFLNGGKEPAVLEETTTSLVSKKRSLEQTTSSTYLEETTKTSSSYMAKATETGSIYLDLTDEGDVDEYNRELREETTTTSPPYLTKTTQTSLSYLQETSKTRPIYFPDEVYVDGSCEYNGQPRARAGYAVWFEDGHEWNFKSRLEGEQTNQRAELMAEYKCLQIIETKIKEHEKEYRGAITIFSDSEYAMNCLGKYAIDWERRGWLKADGKVPKHLDLIKPCWALFKKLKPLGVSLKYVPAHVGIRGNEAVDALAKSTYLEEASYKRIKT